MGGRTQRSWLSIVATISLLAGFAPGAAASVESTDSCESVPGDDWCEEWVATYEWVGTDDPGPNPAALVRDAALSPDGDQLFVSGFESHAVGNNRALDHRTSAIDTATGKKIWEAMYSAGSIGPLGGAIAVSPDGSTVFVGFTQSNASGEREIVSIAYNAAAPEEAGDPELGEQLWVATFAPPSPGAFSAGASLSGGISLSPDGSTLVAAGREDSTPGHLYVIAYDAATGEQRWLATSPVAMTPQAIGFHPTGGLAYVTGYTEGPGLLAACSTTVVGCAKVGNASSNALFDVVTIAYEVSGDSAGKARWAAAYGADVFDQGMHVSVSEDGDRVFVTGFSTQDPQVNESRIITIGYDAASGERLWAAEYEGGLGRNMPPGPRYANGLAVSPTNDLVFVTGEAADTEGCRKVCQIPVLAYDQATGDLRWSQTYDTPSGEAGTWVAVSPDGSRVFMTGGGGDADGVIKTITVAYDSQTGSQQAVARRTGCCLSVVVPSWDGARVWTVMEGGAFTAAGDKDVDKWRLASYVVPGGAPTPTPDTTDVSFTARSQTSGQYSDETLFEAGLTDSGGDPIAGAELAFELTEAESARSFTATTDSDGLASVTPTLDEKPGPYQLTVRYAGDDSHQGSASTSSAPGPAPMDPQVKNASGPTSVLVHLRPEATLAEGLRLARAAGADTGTTYDAIKVFVAYGTAGTFKRLAKSPAIEYIEANRRLHYFTETSHTATRGQNVLDGEVKLPDGTSIDGAGVGVAVVDSGIDGTHPDLVDRMGGNVKIICTTPQPVVTSVTGGFTECLGPKQAVALQDTDTPSAGGHGTHVSGIVAGTGAASSGTYHGAAPGATLFGVSVGTALVVENALDGLAWVLENHDRVTPAIKVVNNSWGSEYSRYDPQNGPFHKATWKLQEALIDAGVSVVFAAGNSSGNGSASTTSAECINPTPGIVCVANYDDGGIGTRSGSISATSSRGKSDVPLEWPDISAPGTNIVSTCRVTLPVCTTGSGQSTPENSYRSLSGTSMAAPHVAGIIAQIYQADPTVTPAEVENYLEDTAHKFSFGSAYGLLADPTNPDSESSYDKGHGLVDVVAALNTILDEPEASPTPTGEPTQTPTGEPSPTPTVPAPGNGSSDTMSFVVEKEDSALGLTIEESDGTKKLLARLSELDNSSNGLGQQMIDFYSNDELIGSAVTDPDGIASVVVPPTHSGGDRTYEAIFGGDDYYLGASNLKGGASPSPSPTPDPSESPTDDPSTDPGPTTPAAPSNLTARAASSSRIELAWADTSSNETGFAVERSRNGSEWQEIASAGRDATFHLDMGLDPDTSYFYRVRALNPTGYSPYSNTASATTMRYEGPSGGSNQAPTAPTNMRATSSSPSRIDLSWSDGSNNEDGFALERSRDAGSTWQEIATTGRNQTSYLDSGLAADSTYHYRVRAFNTAGHSGYSNVASATTKAPASGDGEPEPDPSESSQPVEQVAVGTATTSIAANRELIAFNKDFELSGVVERDDNCTGPLEVEVSRRIHGTNSYESLASTPVNGAGSWGLQIKGKRNASYIAEVETTDTCQGDPSVPTDVLVKANFTARIPARCTGSIRGRVLPANEGEVVLERRAKRRWNEVASKTLNDRSRFFIRAQRCGKHRLVWAEDGAPNEPTKKRFRI